MIRELKKCPCGEVPSLLCIERKDGEKRALAGGNCCDEWMVEFMANYHRVDSPECEELARLAWNRAPRARGD